MTRSPALPGALLLATLLAGCPSGSDEDVNIPSATVERGTFEHTMTVTGEVGAVNSKKLVGPNIRGRLKITQLAEEGSMVKEGEVVVRFDTSDLEREIATLKADISLTEQKIVQKRVELDGSLANLRRGLESTELSKAKIALTVTDSQTVSRIERDKAQLDLREAELSIEKAQQELDAAMSKGDADVQMLGIELRKQQDQLARKSEAVEAGELRAPTDGLVILGETWRGGKIAEGDEVWRGMMIMSLPDLSEMEVLARVHEVDAPAVVEGQRATLRLDAVHGARFGGEVEKKASLARTRREGSEVKYFDLTIKLDETDPRMKPGMTAKVDLLINEVPDVLTVPLEALASLDGEPVVFIEGEKQAIAVTLGPHNATHVVIESGLEAGQRVLLALPPNSGAVPIEGLGRETTTKPGEGEQAPSADPPSTKKKAEGA